MPYNTPEANASPAPFESIAYTGYPGICFSMPSFEIIAP
jgi:hypothetical protein